MIRGWTGFTRPGIRLCAIGLLLWGASAWALDCPVPVDVSPATSSTLSRDLGEQGITTEVIDSYALPFAASQYQDGSYLLPQSVQTHMKAEIAMVLASRAAGNGRYAESAQRDLLWIIRNRMEPSGGLSWNGSQDMFFFEVHQHWFLTASELVRQAAGGPDSLTSVQRRAWLFLIQNNSAGADFYYHNLYNHGAFFAYRSVDREGHFQTQAPFKGSYEVGAALWSLALHLGHGWLDVGAGNYPGHTVDEYLRQLVAQTQLPPLQKGFFDPEKGVWIRSLLWNGLVWNGWETHDTKYALHTSEGALLYTILTGRTELLDEQRRDLEDLLGRVRPNGTVAGIPDGYGSPGYEYGQALTVLGLGAQVSWGPDTNLRNRSLQAARRVAAYIIRTFTPVVSEDRAIILGGLCRLYEAERLAGGFAEKDGAGSAGVVSPTNLAAWPNPMTDRTFLHFELPMGSTGFLRVLDINGRELRSTPVASGDGDGIVWDGRDDRGRLVPAGQYRILLDVAGSRRSTSVSIIR